MDAICYGPNSFGQLSSNKTDTILEQLEEKKRFLKLIVLSWNKSYILLDDGTVFVQGLIDSQMFTQKTVLLPFQSQLKKITCLEKYDLFLTEEGELWKYTSNEWEIVKLPIKQIPNKDSKLDDNIIIDVCSSDVMHLVLSNLGSVFSIPVEIDLPFSVKIKKICCGLEHSLCLAENGSVYIWGGGSRGQLGNGSLNHVEHPELLIALDGLIVTDIDAGGWHSAAVTISGDLYTWGWNNFGQLGFSADRSIFNDDKDDSYVTVLAEPKVVDWPNDKEVQVKQVSCGTRHTVVLLEDSSIWGCGWNKYGQINPFLRDKYFDQMKSIPVPNYVKSVHSISAMSWYTVLYTDCKSD